MLSTIEIPKLILALSICLFAIPVNIGWHHFYVHIWLPGNPTQKSLKRYIDSLPKNKDGIECLLQLKADRQSHQFAMQFELFRILYSLRCSFCLVGYFSYMVLAPYALLVLAFN